MRQPLCKSFRASCAPRRAAVHEGDPRIWSLVIVRADWRTPVHQPSQRDRQQSRENRPACLSGGWFERTHTSMLRELAPLFTEVTGVACSRPPIVALAPKSVLDPVAGAVARPATGVRRGHRDTAGFSPAADQALPRRSMRGGAVTLHRGRALAAPCRRVDGCGACLTSLPRCWANRPLERVQPNPGHALSVLGMARRHVHTAALLADTTDAERAFTAAYDGARKALIAVPPGSASGRSEARIDTQACRPPGV